MTKFIQVCASQNDLFALDAGGDIYQYHFNIKTWVKLIGNRESEERIPSSGTWPQSTRPHNGEGVGDNAVSRSPMAELPTSVSNSSS
jgi:hypothetical protein